MDGHSEPYRFERNRYGGGVLIDIREDMPPKYIMDHKLPPSRFFWVYIPPTQVNLMSISFII